MGVPLLAPTPKLLATWHSAYGFVGHKGPGNTPWRRTPDRKRVPNDAFAWLTHDPHMWYAPQPAVPDPLGCAYDPNDACNVNASVAWLQFSEPYTWPHVTYFSSFEELITLAKALYANATRRQEISDAMKVFFRGEHARAVQHAQHGLHRAMRVAEAQRKKGPASIAEGPPMKDQPEPQAAGPSGKSRWTPAWISAAGG